MDDNSIIKLPEADDMQARLEGVNDEPHLIERFYPIIMRKAGGETTGMGLVMAMTLAVSDYCQGLPPIMQSLMLDSLVFYVRALLDDENARQEALDALAAMGLPH